MNVYGLQLAASYTAGAGSILLVDGGSQIVLPATVTITTAKTYSGAGAKTQTTYQVNSVAGNRVFLGSVLVGSDANYGVGSYVDAAGPSSFLDLPSVKGNLLVGTGAGYGTLPAATDGQSLVLDASQPLGVKWSTGSSAAGGSAGQIQYNNASVLAGAANISVGSSGELLLGAIATPASPTNGAEWYDSTQLCRTWRRGGMNVFTGGPVFNMVAVKTNALTGAQSLIDTTGAIGTVVLPAGALNVVGRRLTVRGGGYLTTAAASQGNFNLTIFLGATCIGVTGNLALVASKTKFGFDFEAHIVCKAAGGAGVGKLDVTGRMAAQGNNSSGAGPFPSSFCYGFQNSSGGSTTSADAATQITIDLTAGYTFDLKGTFSAADGTNTIGIQSLTLEIWG